MKSLILIIVIFSLYYFDFRKLILITKSTFKNYIFEIMSLKRSKKDIEVIEGIMVRITKNGLIFLFNILVLSIPYFVTFFVLVSSDINKIISYFFAFLPYLILITKK